MSGSYAARRPVAPAYPRIRIRWTALAWLIAGTSWAMAAAAVVALTASDTAPPNVADWVMDVVTGVVYGGVVLMMLPRSRHPVVWLLAITALGCAASGLATGYVGLDGDWPAQDLAFYLPFAKPVSVIPASKQKDLQRGLAVICASGDKACEAAGDALTGKGGWSDIRLSRTYFGVEGPPANYRIKVAPKG